MSQLPMPEVAGVRHHHVEVAGVRLHVAEAGSGPAVVCLHGWPQHWWAWRHLLTGLADSHRVICPDLRGYGWSDVPASGYEKEQFATDLLGLLDALDLERVSLAGHDWGGLAGFMACIRAPERFERFLSLNTGHPFPGTASGGLRAAVRFAYQPFLAAPGVGPRLARNVMPQLIARIGARTAWTPEEREIYLAPFRDPARARAASLTYRSFLAAEAVPILRGRYAGARLRVPTLAVHGDADPAVSPEMIRGGEAYADSFAVEIVPGVGHFIVDEAPDLVLDRARAFFA